MCQAAASVLSGLDAAALLPDEAAILVTSLSRLTNQVEAARARCALRAAEAKVHLRAGYRSPAAWLADQAGGSVGAAVRSLSGAAAAEQVPALGEALRQGELSSDQAALVAEATEEDPASAGEVVERARSGRLRDLRAHVEARRVARSSEADLAARHEALRRRRFLRTWTGPDGACRGEFSLAPADAAPLLARLEREREERFEEARRRGEREPLEAYAADALCALSGGIEAPTADGPRARVLLRVDLPALLRGRREGDEVCELAGVGPVPLATARELLSDAVVDLVVRKGVDVVGVTSLGRTIPTAVRTALRDRDPTCVVPGCGATHRLEIDHWRVDFARGGPTSLDNLAMLCQFHHRMKTHRGWRLSGGPGRWRWVGPEPASREGSGPASREGAGSSPPD